ncbi:peptidoglycan DD-metalloendopeptidase family protein [Cyanobacterium stanieri LEGE 03274]|uniref:Peptidoglycan DD-metalloendopeptidase family protein n=1 Tax=Cyanobacterium stanieri LEGE 03274 TaxID=1828756 RepID=A0ABR9V4T4_9CHRO|nr:M23 family metallopeptidase [Cyanobacterium stanieri]MBE9222900.1 peptidoglycan DD-metalloendopeptidase family protein [Cyanobacterium stanieri LEGE 03274]
MNFQQTSNHVYKGAFAIALGIIAIPESASAVVINESSINSPTLLVSNPEQIASLNPNQGELNQNSETLEKTEFDIASNRRLRQLLSANDQPELSAVFQLENQDTENIISAQEISTYQNNPETNNSSLNFTPTQETTIAQSQPIPIAVENVNQDVNQGIPIQVVPAVENNSENFSQNQPVLIPTQTEFSFENNTPTQDFQSNNPNTFNDNSSTSGEDFTQAYEPEYRETAVVPIEVQSFTPNNQPTLISNQETFDFNVRELNNNDPTQVTPPREVASIPIQIDFYNPANMPPPANIDSPDIPPQLNSPEQFLPETERPFNGYIWPAKGVFTSGYGPRWGRMHRGIDIAGPVGTPIVAAADGEVITSGWSTGGYGNWVRIRHNDGSITLYAHHSRNHVRRGQRVRQGQLIADMGSTGFSTGPHLHFEIHRGGRAVNPMSHLARR